MLSNPYTKLITWFRLINVTRPTRGITMYWSCKNHGRIKYVELRSIKLGCRGIGNLRWTSIPSGVGWGGGRVEIPMDLQWRCGDFGPIANSLLAEKWLIKTKELNRNQSKQLWYFKKLILTSLIQYYCFLNLWIFSKSCNHLNVIFKVKVTVAYKAID